DALVAERDERAVDLAVDERAAAREDDERADIQLVDDVRTPRQVLGGRGDREPARVGDADLLGEPGGESAVAPHARAARLAREWLRRAPPQLGQSPGRIER